MYFLSVVFLLLMTFHCEPKVNLVKRHFRYPALDETQFDVGGGNYTRRIPQ